MEASLRIPRSRIHYLTGKNNLRGEQGRKEKEEDEEEEEKEVGEDGGILI